MLSLWLTPLLILLVAFPWFMVPAGLIFFGVLSAMSMMSAATVSFMSGVFRGPSAFPIVWLGETIASFVVWLVTMPLAWLIASRDVRRDGKPAVLLLHGYGNNAGALWLLRWRLIRAGYGVSTLNLEPLYGDIDDFAAQVDKKLQRLNSKGIDTVTLIGHSMGGLVARATLRRYGVGRIARIITLGSPHRGTWSAKMAIGTNGRQMEPGNPWLIRLAIDEGLRWPCPITSIYSLQDNIITPATYGELHDAKNIPVRNVGHVSMPFSRRIFNLVQQEIEATTAWEDAGPPRGI